MLGNRRLGSFGEGATLSFDEKLQILRTCVGAIQGRGPVVASISALTTSEAVASRKQPLTSAAMPSWCCHLMSIRAIGGR